MSQTQYVYIRLKRPEGYEDVHPELVLEDAHIHPDFEPEVISCSLVLEGAGGQIAEPHSGNLGSSINGPESLGETVTNHAKQENEHGN